MKQALLDPAWCESMDKEDNAIMENDTYEECTLNDVPEGVPIYRTFYIYKVKDDGRLKSRLVVRGDQGPEVEDPLIYYAPTGSSTVLRLLLSLAGKENYTVEQFDIGNAFCTAPTPEDSHFYVYPPPNRPQFTEQGERRVLRLKKYLYGLPASPKGFNDFLAETIIKEGFSRSKHDPCLFTKMTPDGKPVWLFCFVDDCIVISPRAEAVSATIDNIERSFKITRMGAIKRYLNIDIARNADGSFELSQAHTLREILQFAGMANCKPKSSPLEMGTLDNGDCKALSDKAKELYTSIIGKLMYVAVHTRPDLLTSIGILSQFSREPQGKHMTCLKHLLGYVRGTQGLTLSLGKRGYFDKPHGFSDADWGKDKSRKSRTGYIFFLNGAISWTSQLSGVHLSSAESELVGMCACAQEALFLSYLLQELHLTDSNVTTTPPCLVGDNQSALQMANYGVFGKQLRHVEIKFRFIHEKVNDNKLRIKYVSTNENVADIMTKPLPKGKNAAFRSHFLRS